MGPAIIDQAEGAVKWLVREEKSGLSTGYPQGKPLFGRKMVVFLFTPKSRLYYY